MISTFVYCFKKMASRRSFIKRSLVFAFTPALGKGMIPALMSEKPAYHLKTSCNLYSFNQLLSSGNITLKEAILLCAEYGFDAVDPTGYYFDGYPFVPSDQDIYSIKNTTFRHGLDISGTGIRTDFATPDVDELKASIALARQWVDVAAKLGAPTLRVFAGKDIAPGRNKVKVFDQIISSLKQCVDFGAARGVVITMQNHFNALKTKEDVLEIMAGVDSPWFGLNLDIGSLRMSDPYADIAELVPYACTWQIKENVYRNNVKEPVNLPKLIRIIKDKGYRGYLPLETLRPSDPRTKLKPFLEEIKELIK